MNKIDFVINCLSMISRCQKKKRRVKHAQWIDVGLDGRDASLYKSCIEMMPISNVIMSFITIITKFWFSITLNYMMTMCTIYAPGKHISHRSSLTLIFEKLQWMNMCVWHTQIRCSRWARANRWCSKQFHLQKNKKFVYKSCFISFQTMMRQIEANDGKWHAFVCFAAVSVLIAYNYNSSTISSEFRSLPKLRSKNNRIANYTIFRLALINTVRPVPHFVMGFNKVRRANDNSHPCW